MWSFGSHDGYNVIEERSVSVMPVMNKHWQGKHTTVMPARQSGLSGYQCKNRGWNWQGMRETYYNIPDEQMCKVTAMRLYICFDHPTNCK